MRSIPLVNISLAELQYMAPILTNTQNGRKLSVTVSISDKGDLDRQDEPDTIETDELVIAHRDLCAKFRNIEKLVDKEEFSVANNVVDDDDDEEEEDEEEENEEEVCSTDLPRTIAVFCSY